ncbi:hypothetical protein PV762_07200 [Mitsuaria sp. CC2]|uniref:hypothetical protein n=1 Tax=Mitsuaria sp. CC2 TaxID=3029186 RepID=UPI003B8AE2D9
MMRTNDLVIGLFVVALLLAACGDGDRTVSPSASSASASSSPPRQVHARFGGALVSIPAEFAQGVEYDGEPTWKPVPGDAGERRGNDPKIKSFGFEFRYPDKTGPANKAAAQERARLSPADSPWIFVGLKSGELYPGPGGVQRIAAGVLNTPDPRTGAAYARAAQDTCGLETYVLQGELTQAQREDAKDIFVARDGTGQARTFLECSNRSVRSAPCTQRFDLEPRLHASVYLLYPRTQMCEWSGIQQATREVTESFIRPSR